MKKVSAYITTARIFSCSSKEDIVSFLAINLSFLGTEEYIVFRGKEKGKSLMKSRITSVYIKTLCIPALGQ